MMPSELTSIICLRVSGRDEIGSNPIARTYILHPGSCIFSHAHSTSCYLTRKIILLQVRAISRSKDRARACAAILRSRVIPRL